MLLKANTIRYYFNLNAKGRQKKHIYNINTSFSELRIAIQLRGLPSFWTYIKKPNMSLVRLPAGRNHPLSLHQHEPSYRYTAEQHEDY